MLRGAVSGEDGHLSPDPEGGSRCRGRDVADSASFCCNSFSGGLGSPAGWISSTSTSRCSSRPNMSDPSPAPRRARRLGSLSSGRLGSIATQGSGLLSVSSHRWRSIRCFGSGRFCGRGRFRERADHLVALIPQDVAGEPGCGCHVRGGPAMTADDTRMRIRWPLTINGQGLSLMMYRAEYLSR